MSQKSFNTVDDVTEAAAEYGKTVLDELALDASRDDLIEAIDQEADSCWDHHLGTGPISSLDEDDIENICGDCSLILRAARNAKQEETDRGLWEGMNAAGVLASKAYFSMRNLITDWIVSHAEVDVNDSSMDSFRSWKLQEAVSGWKETNPNPLLNMASVVAFACGLEGQPDLMPVVNDAVFDDFRCCSVIEAVASDSDKTETLLAFIEAVKGLPWNPSA